MSRVAPGEHGSLVVRDFAFNRSRLRLRVGDGRDE